MRTYLISYDLANPAAKKHAIADIIMSLGEKWARPLEQTWYVTTRKSQAGVENELAWMLGDEDGLLIQEAKNDAVLTNTSLRWFKHRPQTTTIDNVIAFEAPQQFQNAA